jgi:ABC-type transport system involved in multi-copper enzyme maturation permease subunit
LGWRKSSCALHAAKHNDWLTALPVITRELKAESRRPWNCWARLAAGALVTGSFAWTILPSRGQSVSGVSLFNGVSMLALGLIWSVAPLLTADCLSRERREGTLGLLFLTPLTAGGIVVGKSIVHALRAGSLVMAAVPAISISLLFGGVTGSAILIMVLHQAGALCLALAAGLLASAWSRDWIRSTIASVSLTVLFAFFYYQGLSWVFSAGTILPAVVLFSMAGALFCGAIILAAYRIRLTWQEGPPSKWVLWFRRVFCSPLFWKDLLRLSSQARLQRTPIAWLYERTATARVAKWVWCAGAVFAACSLVASSGHNPVFFVFELGFGLAMAFAGAGSFRRERQLGVMELLLVAPLEMEEIVDARLGALRKQFAPAVALLVSPLIAVLLVVGEIGTGLVEHAILVLTSWMILPALGLYFSFRVRRFLTAWLLAVGVGLVAPFFLARLLTQPGATTGLAPVLQIAVGACALNLLRQGLTRSHLAGDSP